jgi:FPC/CPF motif-containing protein YcgG
MIVRPLAEWLGTHPCIGARILGHSKTFYTCIPGELTTISSALKFLECLDGYFSLTDQNDPIEKSLLVLFHDPIASPHDFFTKFWSFAQVAHDIDSLTHQWDPTVSSDTSDNNFELSFRGRGVFPTTFHPFHERTARRFMYPGWAHNQSSQFRSLRETNQFETWQKKIRQADASTDPSGTHNPLLADTGTVSAATQITQYQTSEYPFVSRNPSDREQVLIGLKARAIHENAKHVSEYLEALQQ